VTISDFRLIITTDGQREEQELKGQTEYEGALRRYFGVDLLGLPETFLLT
jgi:hypothetical protein